MPLITPDIDYFHAFHADILISPLLFFENIIFLFHDIIADADFHYFAFSPIRLFSPRRRHFLRLPDADAISLSRFDISRRLASFSLICDYDAISTILPLLCFHVTFRCLAITFAMPLACLPDAAIAICHFLMLFAISDCFSSPGSISLRRQIFASFSLRFRFR
jgi:hypothetical protein